MHTSIMNTEQEMRYWPRVGMKVTKETAEQFISRIVDSVAGSKLDEDLELETENKAEQLIIPKTRDYESELPASSFETESDISSEELEFSNESFINYRTENLTNFFGQTESLQGKLSMRE